jgi:type IV pilus assembly protein PilB
MDPAQTNTINSQGIFSQIPTGPTSKTVTDIAFEEHLISPEQYSALKVESANQGIPLDQALLNNKFISDEQYYEVRAKLMNVPFVSMENLPSSPEALGFITKPLAERLHIIPFAYDKDRNSISIAMADPLDLDALNFIRQKTGASISVFQGIPQEITDAIQSQYSAGLVGEVKEALKETEQISQVKTFDKESIANVIQDAPIAKIVATTLEYAMKSRASDIHIEPQEDRVRVRYRIDGILYERLSLPKGVQEAVTSRIKILSDLKIDEHRSPQDGRFNFKFGSQEVDLRVSVLPIAWGEKIVMRLLRKSGGVPTLNDLGLRGNALKNLEASILRPHGIIIVVGPTGSGKTSTLYSLLTRLNTTRVNIMTLEDPIEYQIAGINQVQINSDIGLTFAAGLRAFLRQDPNIILVGEIRDKETTELAIQASLTGHLVFSTLHTSSAAGTIPRLMDMGAETLLLASTLSAIVGQRIARKICTQCKIEYTPPQEIIEEIKKELGPLMPPNPQNTPVKLYKGKGCDFCGQSGFLGRVGMFEVMPVSEKISRMILEKSDAQSIEQQARTEGMISMKQDGYLKVLEGVSTVDEVLRVAQN